MWDGEVFVTYANDNWDSLKERSLDAIEGGTDCAAFVSVVLQDFDFDVHAVYTDGLGPTDVPEQTLAYSLFDLGFTRYDDPGYYKQEIFALLLTDTTKVLKR